MRDNYLTQENGCQICEVSSEKPNTSASNILNSNPKSMWIANGKFPHYCVIDTSRMKAKPKVFNRVGFYCWHDYPSNPAFVELAYMNASQEWSIVAKIRLSKTADWQYFKIKEIVAEQMSKLKMIIHENFDDQITFLNQMVLGFEREDPPPELQAREKTFSEYTKLTSAERELKKAHDQIKNLVEEQQVFRNTMKSQTDLIANMQRTIVKLAKNFEKMQSSQDVQNEKIRDLESVIEQILRNDNSKQGRERNVQTVEKIRRDRSQTLQDKETRQTLKNEIGIERIYEQEEEYPEAERNHNSAKQMLQYLIKSNKNSVVSKKSHHLQLQAREDFKVSDKVSSEQELSSYSDKDSFQKPRSRASEKKRLVVEQMKQLEHLLAIRQKKQHLAMRSVRKHKESSADHEQ